MGRFLLSLAGPTLLNTKLCLFPKDDLKSAGLKFNPQDVA